MMRVRILSFVVNSAWPVGLPRTSATVLQRRYNHHPSTQFRELPGLGGQNRKQDTDVIMLSMPGCQPVAILGFKPWRRVRLETYPISRVYMYLIPLHSHLSQLVTYMRINMLKFGALSAYKTTHCIRQKNYNPTVRECLLAMAAFASEDSEFVEPEGFNEAQVISLCSYSTLYAILSPGYSSSRPGHHERGDFRGTYWLAIDYFWGVVKMPSQETVNCKQIIKGSKEKAIFEVMWDGRPAIAKCWSSNQQERYADE